MCVSMYIYIERERERDCSKLCERPVSSSPGATTEGFLPIFRKAATKRWHKLGGRFIESHVAAKHNCMYATPSYAASIWFPPVFQVPRRRSSGALLPGSLARATAFAGGRRRERSQNQSRL